MIGKEAMRKGGLLFPCLQKVSHDVHHVIPRIIFAKDLLHFISFLIIIYLFLINRLVTGFNRLWAVWSG